MRERESALQTAEEDLQRLKLHCRNTPIWALPARIFVLYGASGARNQNSRNCSIMTHVGQNLVSFSRWRQQLERSIHFASLLHVWWERSSGTWHVALNVNRTTWPQGPFRWSFPPHKSVNKGQKHIAAHALRACSARSLSAYALRSSNHSSGSNNTNSGARNT